MYKFYLTSIGYKILACITTVAMAPFCCVLIVFHEQIPLGAILFSAFVVLFCLLAVIICFIHRIVISLKTGNIIIVNLKRKITRIDEIKDITVNTNLSLDPKKYCSINIILLNGSIIKIPGYSSLLKKAMYKKHGRLSIE